VLALEPRIIYTSQVTNSAIQGAAMRHLLIAALLCSAVACTKGDGGGSAAGPDGADGPAESDWVDLAAQFASIATDGLQAAYVSSGVDAGSSTKDTAPGLTAGASQLNAPSADVSGSATYFCCGASTARSVLIASSLSGLSGGSAPLVQTFADTDLSWQLPSAPSRTLPISVSDLAIRGTLIGQSGTFAGTQQLKLTGTVTYTLPSNQKKTGTLSVNFGYTTYPIGAPTTSGQAGPVNVTNQQPTTPPPARCTSVPREGCGPCSVGNCGPAPCGIWPACPK
jgi:hypothetical protein